MAKSNVIIQGKHVRVRGLWQIRKNLQKDDRILRFWKYANPGERQGARDYTGNKLQQACTDKVVAVGHKDLRNLSLAAALAVSGRAKLKWCMVDSNELWTHIFVLAKFNGLEGLRVFHFQWTLFNFPYNIDINTTIKSPRNILEIYEE